MLFDLVDLLLLFLDFLLLFPLVSVFFVPLVEDAVDSEVDFPKNTFDEGGDDGDDDNVHEAEEDHD